MARSGEPTETEYVDGSKREFGKGSHLPRQPSQYQADHGHLDERLASLHLPLVVLARMRVDSSLTAVTAREQSKPACLKHCDELFDEADEPRVCLTYRRACGSFGSLSARDDEEQV